MFYLGKYQYSPGWWSPKSNDEYNKKSQCIVNHYAQLIVEQLPERAHVDGELTLGENIADIGGNRLAYDAHGK